MDYSQIRLMAMMKTSMAYLSERQDVISQNISNANTPGYKARELKKLDFEKLAQAEARRLALRATAPQHSAGMRDLSPHFRELKQKKTYETTPVKNNVSLEEQSAKMAENTVDFQTTTNLYHKTVAMFKIALGNSGGA
ncbi:MAG: flagellar basal body rod protein FlgB [Alphaproteobacteria bacterium]|nr:flagellar basal body rod protein FlgB [Alphaproteobacteria bacterium]